MAVVPTRDQTLRKRMRTSGRTDEGYKRARLASQREEKNNGPLFSFLRLSLRVAARARESETASRYRPFSVFHFALRGGGFLFFFFVVVVVCLTASARFQLLNPVRCFILSGPRVNGPRTSIIYIIQGAAK